MLSHMRSCPRRKFMRRFRHRLRRSLALDPSTTISLPALSKAPASPPPPKRRANTEWMNLGGMCRLKSSSMSAAFWATVASSDTRHAPHRNSSPSNESGLWITLISYARMLTDNSSSRRCQSWRSVQSCVSSFPVSSHLTVWRWEGIVCHFSGSKTQMVPLCIFSSFQSTRTRRPTNAGPLILQPLFCPSRPAMERFCLWLFTSPKNAWKQLNPWGPRVAGSMVQMC
mmetsp:Transcript_69616/g.145169  ORF Transcript_69616/g.145169 Transcript_69616/m.145169 type:complete len:227 (-) Transcript_69616:831-1511(-)